MRLKKITCSGANEYTPIEPMIYLLQKYPRAELGIQVSGKKAAFSTARYWWITALYETLQNWETPIPIALHINSDWVERFCQGDIPEELFIWLKSYRLKNGEPFIKRVQLNFKIGREKTPNMEQLLKAMAMCPQRIILSYNQDNADFIKQVYDRGAIFDLLFDASHGEGVLANSYLPPVFPDVLQGYAGGLSPENVTEELWKINKVMPIGADCTIDAEGALKGDDKHFSLKKCELYLKGASRWDEI